MPPLRRFRSTRSSSPRRKSSWGVGPETTVNGGPETITGTTAQIATTAVTLTLDGATLVRTRGELVVNILTAAAQADGFHGAFGIAKATAPAFTAGVAAVPTPLTEEDWDGWLYHRYFSLLSGGIINQGVSADEDIINSTIAALRVEVDSKAMRKVAITEVIYAVIEVVEVGTSTLRWSFNSRLLFKLP